MNEILETKIAFTIFGIMMGSLIMVVAIELL